jgi:hypothetical protein
MKKCSCFYIIVFLNFSLIQGQANWRYAVLGDTHVGSSDTVAEMIPFILEDSVDFVVVVGDLVEGGLGTPGSQLLQELENWKTIFAPIYNAGIPVYGLRGNHEDDANNDVNMWNTAFSGSYAFPQNGPIGETNLTYSFTHKNAKLIMLDVYKNIHQVNQTWLDQELTSNTSQHVFTFGHEAAFKVFHGDCLDDSIVARDQFWISLKNSGCKVYFCGHDHFLDAALVEDGDGNSQNDIYQYLVGTGGGWLMSQYSNYNGLNSAFSPNRIFHEMEFGYSIVEINGETNADCGVRISWKKRTFDTITQINSYKESPYVIDYSNCNTSSIQDKNNVSFSFFPNPVEDDLFLKNNFEDLTIYDLMGNKVFYIPKNTLKIELINLNKGLYIISNGQSSAIFHMK